MISNEEYIKNGGVRCPFCKSDDIRTVGSLESCGINAFQSVACNCCGKNWTDEYTFTGFSEDE